MTNSSRLTTPKAHAISCDEALKVARLDAEAVYRDLGAFRIHVMLGPDGWHVDYEFNLPGVQGGGPHYVIDSDTGAIVSKRYEQ
jgi:hypothetical protein